MFFIDFFYESSMYSSFDEFDMIFGSNMYSVRFLVRIIFLGFEQGSWIGIFTQFSVMIFKFVSDLVDEFLQLDIMKEVVVFVEVNLFSIFQKLNNLLDLLDLFLFVFGILIIL